MSSTKPSLADLIRTVAEEESARLAGPSPTPHELARYAAGDLTEEEAERIREHLALRAEGRDEVLALNLPLPVEPPDEEYRAAGEDVEEAWRRLSRDLDSGAETAPPAATGRRSWREALKEYFSFPVTGPALVTAAVLGVVSASLWQREAPWLNVEVVDLVPASLVERSEPDPGEALRSSGRPHVWNLIVTDLTDYSAYEVEILDAGGESVWSGRTRQRAAAGNLNVHLPPGYLDPGIYRVRLHGVAGGDRLLLEEYVVRIAP